MVSVLVSSFDFIFTILSQLEPFQIPDQFLILCICSPIFTISIYEITYNFSLITGKTNSIPRMVKWWKLCHSSSFGDYYIFKDSG